MEMKNTKEVYEVNIADVPLKLLSEHPEQLVKEMVELVNEKIKESLSTQKTPSIQTAAIIAALNIAEDYILLKSKARQRLDRLSDHTESVLAQLDSPDDKMPEINN